MKYIGALALALLVVPLAAGAQEPPQGPPPGASGPSENMQQSRRQLLELRRETRSQMLAALSAQHRSLLANVVGQLATSSAPDVEAAARQLDAALSPQEAQAIVSAEMSMRTQLQTGMPNAPAPDGGPNRPPVAPGAGNTPDAGMTLIRAAISVAGPARAPRTP